ncbi:MAG: DNA polymerase III subunit beta [Lachnospiraceae bacterium]|nr:DNA polymerase III subunit beta [Lachnospiraceae bacterium]
MRLQIAKNYLAEGIQIVSKAVPAKTTMPILECILIDASSGADIFLIANDMELGIQTVVPGMILEKGIVAVDARIFSEIIRKLPDGDVFLTYGNDKIDIVCGKAKFSIPGKSGEDFVYLPKVEKKEEIRISQYSLRSLISKTIFSISGNDSSGMMTGELLEIRGSRMRMVALDGHRIAIRNIELIGSYEDHKVIIPGKTLNEISKILSGSTENMVSIYFTDRHALFEFDQTMVVSRLIEGEYYSIDKMLSNRYNTKFTVDRKEFLSCIDRATLLVKEEDKKPVIIMVHDDTMEMKINTVMGRMDEAMDIVKEGDDINIGFNPKFLIDALRAVDEDQVTMYMVSPKAPCFIRDEEGMYCYLILPVNFITID